MIYGCDLGSRRIALACPEQNFTAVLRLRRRRKGEAPNPGDDVQRLGDFVATHVPPDAELWVEHPIVGGSGNRLTAIRLGMAAGAACAAHFPGPSRTVLPMVWKKAVVGDGHADKDRITEWLKAHHPAIAAAAQGDQDLVDAACVGLFGNLDRAARLEAERELSRSGPGDLLRAG